MRLYALLLLASFAIASHAASIPEKDLPHKNIDEDIKVQQEEQIDQINTINDVDNKLRVKPADIPVQVVVEDVKHSLKINADKGESEEIVRQPIDLKNPGIPQRQEHNSQTPEAYSSELSLIETYKKNINEAQAILKQGFQNINDGIQHMFENNEPVQMIQQSIQSLRDGFVDQIDKLNGTVTSYLNSDNGGSPTEQQNKQHIEQLKTGLNALKSEFTKGVNVLADGVLYASSLRADAADGSNPAPTAPPNVFFDYISNFQETISNYIPAWPGQQTTTVATLVIPPDDVQLDEAPASQAPPFNWPFSNPFAGLLGQGQVSQQSEEVGPFGSGNGPLVHAWQQLWQSVRPGQSPEPSQTAKPETSSSGELPSNQPESQTPTESTQVQKTTLGPIRQILQNNPISQGIASAVQNLQNINRPETPREPEKEKEHATDDQQIKGFRPGAGDNNNVVSGVEEIEKVKEVEKEVLPEVQEQKIEGEKEHKTEVTADKTE